jgi:hypothetical protein
MNCEGLSEHRRGEGEERFFGGEEITPTAVLPEDPRAPNGSLLMDAAWRRGWLAAMTRANGRTSVSPEQRVRNLQEIADEAGKAGISPDTIKEHLRSLGVAIEAQRT